MDRKNKIACFATAATAAGAAALVATRMAGLPLKACAACAVAGAVSTGIAGAVHIVLMKYTEDDMFGSRGSDAAAGGGATATAIQAGDVGKGARVAADELPNVATAIISAPTTSLKTLEPQQGKAAATAAATATAAARTIEEQLWDAWNELPPPRAKSKELKETIAFFNAVKKTLFPRHNRKRKVLIDAGGGNGYLSWVLLAYGRVDRAIVADILFPDNTKQLLEKGLGKMRIAPNAMELIQCDIEEDFGTLG